MRSFEYSEQEEIDELNAEKWQLDLIKMNPEYVCWGPYEDYMSGEDKGWRTRALHDSWEDFGPWQLDELNELVNFYFEVARESENCEHCDATGYSVEAKRIADAWYDFEGTGQRWRDKITQDEVDALWEKGRLTFDFKEKPTAEQVNAWSKSGMGHDAINRMICVEARLKRLGLYDDKHCKKCDGKGYIYTADKAYVNLILWFIHPRKGCSRGVEVKNIKESELPQIFEYLKQASQRNADRFSKIGVI